MQPQDNNNKNNKQLEIWESRDNNNKNNQQLKICERCNHKNIIPISKEALTGSSFEEKNKKLRRRKRY